MGFRTTCEIRGTYLDQAINIERLVDEALCELFRIDHDHWDLFKQTLLGATITYKIDALEHVLRWDSRESDTDKIATNLKTMNWCVICAIVGDPQCRSLPNRRGVDVQPVQGWRGQGENGVASDTAGLAQGAGTAYLDLLGLRGHTRLARGRTIYINAVSGTGGSVWWDVLPLSSVSVDDPMFNDFIGGWRSGPDGLGVV